MRLVVLFKEHDRKPFAHQRHGPVPHFLSTETFCMQTTRFFQLQRRFLRNPEAETSTDHVEVCRNLQRAYRGTPIELPCTFELIWNAQEGVEQRTITCPT